MDPEVVSRALPAHHPKACTNAHRKQRERLLTAVCSRCSFSFVARQAARVVELSVYCLEESARCYHQLGQCVLIAPLLNHTPRLSAPARCLNTWHEPLRYATTRRSNQCIVTCTNVLALYPQHLEALIFRGMARAQAGPLRRCARAIRQNAPSPALILLRFSPLTSFFAQSKA